MVVNIRFDARKKYDSHYQRIMDFLTYIVTNKKDKGLPLLVMSDSGSQCSSPFPN